MNKLLKFGLALTLTGMVTFAFAQTQAQPPLRTVSDLLNLTGRQVAKLDQLYEYVSAVRLAEQRKIDRFRSQLQSANAAKTERIHKDMAKSEKRAYGAVVRVQREAKSLLSPGQVYAVQARVEELPSSPDDWYKRLLILTPEEFAQLPPGEIAAQRWTAAKAAFERRDTRYWNAGSRYDRFGYWGSGWSLGFGFGGPRPGWHVGFHSGSHWSPRIGWHSGSHIGNHNHSTQHRATGIRIGGRR